MRAARTDQKLTVCCSQGGCLIEVGQKAFKMHGCQLVGDQGHCGLDVEGLQLFLAFKLVGEPEDLGEVHLLEDWVQQLGSWSASGSESRHNTVVLHNLQLDIRCKVQGDVL